MPDKKPHTIALRLTNHEWRGLHVLVDRWSATSTTEVLRQLLDVNMLADLGREENND